MTDARRGNVPSTARSLIVPTIAFAATGAILGGLMAGPGASGGWYWLHWTFKPLATVLVIGVALRAPSPLSLRYRQRVVIGLAFALLGDVLLMLPGDFFVPGLAAFLLAHLAFLAAWLDDSRFAVRPQAWLACLLAAVGLLWLLWPFVAPALRVPVAVYALVLATMAGQAAGRAWQHAAMADPLAHPARRAAFGAVLFMVSDSLLAWDRFRHALPLSALWVLGTYYPAIGLIAWSVRREFGHGR
ncbi:lysoplasmalogenase [Dyella ginsengisoli]|uniref:Lysoplasmalogenase n=1 Tax=Dyella ginsengisoli TaxID=363848 RepID=A0ABW8JXY4_9GAMM